MTTAQMAENTSVYQSRAMLATIVSEADLTLEEKAKLFDLMQH
jgi:phage gp16-like protein